MLPVMARNVLESIRLIANVSRLLADRCVAGIVANVEHCRRLAESSPSIVTPLNRYIGYENAAAVAKKALKENKTIRQVVLESGFVDDGKLTEEQLDAALDVLAMTRPRRDEVCDNPPWCAFALFCSWLHEPQRGACANASYGCGSTHRIRPHTARRALRSSKRTRPGLS